MTLLSKKRDTVSPIHWATIKKFLTASQQSKSIRKTAHRSHFSNSLASVMIFVTRHSKLFCSSKMLLARFNSIWLRLYSSTDDSNNCAFCIPIPQNVKYLWNTSTSRSVNSMEPKNHITDTQIQTNWRYKSVKKKNNSLLWSIFTNHLFC